MHISQDNKQAMRNPWVLGWLGLLITVVTVNVAFIVTAFNTTPGLVDDKYYEKGRDVEKNFQSRLDARNRLGWDIRLNTPETIVAGQAGNFSVSLVDSSGMALRNAEVVLQAYRPSDASADIRAQMEVVTDGIYQTRLMLPLKGIWDMKVTVRHGADELEISRRISAVTP